MKDFTRSLLSWNKKSTIYALIIGLCLMAGCKAQGLFSDDSTSPSTSSPQTAVNGMPDTPREFRAVWVATVANIDWPSEPGLPVDQQKQELVDIMDRAAAMNMNAVIFQVRPAADAMYDSKLEPWSAFLTGQMGKAPTPYYDPLKFAVEKAHKRGLELHAWFNPYRARHPADSLAVAPNHVSQQQPELVHDFGDYQWLDPGLPEVRKYSRRVIMDVVKRYDIDGVHLDDYFYPYPSYGGGKEFPDSLSWNQAMAENPSQKRGDWRRHNVDQFIKEVYQAIKAEKPEVKFGISPFGTWRPGYPQGTGGFDAYSQLYADARLWLQEGWVDYFTPQIYNQIDRVIRPFPVMLQWWSQQNKHDRHLWPGLFTSRAAGSDGWPTQEITGQVYIARGQPGITGSIHFSMQSLMGEWNPLVSDMTRGVYAGPALVPASPWLDKSVPEQPKASMEVYKDRLLINVEPGDEEIRWWVLWTKVAGDWEMDIIPGTQRQIAFKGTPATVWPDTAVIAGVDRSGNKGPAKVLSRTQKNQPEDTSIPKPKMVDRLEWGSPPGGYSANAVRRNLAEGTRFEFRDLTVTLDSIIPGFDPPEMDSLLASEKELFPQSAKSISTPDTAKISLYRNGVDETLKVPEGNALNWYGYHIGILAVNMDKKTLAGGLVEFEIATVGSLPVSKAAAQKTGDASQRLRVPHNITDITLHHTGSPKPMTMQEDATDRLQRLFQWGKEARNWWDVPYHYLIARDGTIYEGRDPRFAGDTNTTYDTRGHLLISVMGNYDKQEPTEAQVTAITKLMSWAADKYDLTADQISGHFELADTGCPGASLKKLLENGTLRHAVKEQLNPSSK